MKKTVAPIDVKSEVLSYIGRNRAAVGAQSPFQRMLDAHLEEARRDMVRDGLGRMIGRGESSGSFGELINNINKLKDIDEGYFKKALKKRELAEGFEDRFGTKAGERFKKFRSLIETKAEKYGLDPNLLAALVRQESGFNPYAVSRCGAMGLGQLMPETARSLGVKDPFNAAQNLEGAAKYLRGMLDTFGGKVDLALAAYNAGPGAVKKYGGIPPYSETRGYVKAVRSHYKALTRGALSAEEAA